MTDRTIRWILGLVATGMVISWTVIVLAMASSSGDSSRVDGYPHSLLEQDRRMTEQMAVQSSMGENGMLARSQDPAYIRALEEHVRQFDRMLGRTP